MSPDSPDPAVRPPHPLALALVDRLRDRRGAPVLEIGRGSGRNTRALHAAGFRVVDLESGLIAAGALSTHALLHGTRSSIETLLARIAERVEPDGPFYVTFGSVRDARYGSGTKIEDDVYAPDAGDERGVPHAFFTQRSLLHLVERAWIVESLSENGVDEIAGSWAHGEMPLRAAFHWFAELRRRQ